MKGKQKRRAELRRQAAEQARAEQDAAQQDELRARRDAALSREAEAKARLIELAARFAMVDDLEAPRREAEREANEADARAHAMRSPLLRIGRHLEAAIRGRVENRVEHREGLITTDVLDVIDDMRMFNLVSKPDKFQTPEQMEYLRARDRRDAERGD